MHLRFFLASPSRLRRGRCNPLVTKGDFLQVLLRIECLFEITVTTWATTVDSLYLVRIKTKILHLLPKVQPCNPMLCFQWMIHWHSSETTFRIVENQTKRAGKQWFTSQDLIQATALLTKTNLLMMQLPILILQDDPPRNDSSTSRRFSTVCPWHRSTQVLISIKAT